MRISGDTPVKGLPAFTPCSFNWHQETCLRSPDAFAPHCVLTRLKVAEKPSWHVRPAGPSLGKSLSIGLPWRQSFGDSPTAGRALAATIVGGLQDASAPCLDSCIHLSETLPARITLSQVPDVLCSVFL